jgi:hypothetical protein
MIKRRSENLTKDTYFFLAPHTSITTTIDLSQTYDLSRSGTYDVILTVSFMDYVAADDWPEGTTRSLSGKSISLAPVTASFILTH